MNWQWDPVLDVRARRYRFRILNGSVSRFISIGLSASSAPATAGASCLARRSSNLSYKRIPFHMVANDGNIMEHAVPFDGSMDLDANGNLVEHNAVLPTQGIAERYDIVVDFAAKNGLKAGDKLFFVNTMHHDTGILAKVRIPLADILSEKYKPVLKTDSHGQQEWDAGDPAVGKFMQLNVNAYSGVDQSMDPTQYEPAHAGKPIGKTMIPLWLDRNNPADMAKLQTAIHRDFDFGRSSGTDAAPWTIKSDGGLAYNMDPRRLSAAQQLSTGPTDAGYTGDGTMQVWTLSSDAASWNFHPVHTCTSRRASSSSAMARHRPSGKSGPARTCIASGAVKRTPAPSSSRSTSASSPVPTWSIATTPSTKTIPCCCAGTSSSLASSR